MRGDKIKLMDEMNFEDKNAYNSAKSSMRVQEEISKELVKVFENFLQFFSIEADIEIHNGQIIGKVTQYANNAGYFLLDSDAYSRVRMNYVEKKKFSDIMLENVLAAYHCSMLDVMLDGYSMATQ